MLTRNGEEAVPSTASRGDFRDRKLLTLAVAAVETVETSFLRD